jgi:hypothetical protein
LSLYGLNDFNDFNDPLPISNDQYLGTLVHFRHFRHLGNFCL